MIPPSSHHARACHWPCLKLQEPEAWQSYDPPSLEGFVACSPDWAWAKHAPIGHVSLHLGELLQLDHFALGTDGQEARNKHLGQRLCEHLRRRSSLRDCDTRFDGSGDGVKH